MKVSRSSAASAGLLLIANTLAQQQPSVCPTILQPNYSIPIVAAGWTGQIVVQGLNIPRGILFDPQGALLVVEQGKGITHLTFRDYGEKTCLVKDQQTLLIDNSDLNHGIQLSPDGKTLYASTAQDVLSWPYDPVTAKVGQSTTLITNMTSTDHVSRTLLLSQYTKNVTMLVSRGSNDNMDFGTQQIKSGRSQIKAFDLDNVPAGRPYDYASEGRLLGWGLRNSVGVAEHPTTGGIYSVENSADEIERLGVDVHTDDPGEEMNFHGYLSGTQGGQGGNYGYPDCFAVWGGNLPAGQSLQVGDQFTLNPNQTLNDTTCAKDYVSPRLTFQAHTAPLDLKFSTSGNTAYVSFHGSWNRGDPIGYNLAQINFANGEPVEAATSKTAAISLLQNKDLSACPGGCFRPVGLALDDIGRVFISSDTTGEIIVMQQTNSTGASNQDGSSASGTMIVASSTVSASATVSGTGSATPSASASGNLAVRSARSRPGEDIVMLTGLVVVVSMVFGVAIVL